jgi:hypothetical protein
MGDIKNIMCLSSSTEKIFLIGLILYTVTRYNNCALSIPFNSSLYVHITVTYKKKISKKVQIAGHFIYPYLSLHLTGVLFTTRDTTNKHEADTLARN